MTTVNVNAPKGWYICYKSGTGHSIAHAKRFSTEADAQKKLGEFEPEFKEVVHVVEVK